ncbi:Acetyltransferase (GNAT) family protein [Thermomonospora echinospora]|uniref:Acetyltransferase (GNAT) family protein n=1 Tax=Thermomonospora echinospora TaxID=1992 RepID=A0A1H6BPA9_9ACTN|nr:GNAT family N-acetyltransferase [Thermomonospora echinospora]SEG62520.1 Acetyltransferase (GNAT) family protein [Thermomonospora echinospora]
MKQITVIVDIAPATPYHPAVIALCAEQQAEIEARYPGAGEAPSGIDPQIDFLLARVGDEPVGCGGLKPLEPRVAEVTRMYVRPAHRGQGISRGLLDALEGLAGGRGVRTLRLETGDLQPESIGLYQSSGYRRIPAFGPYQGNALSLCFEKHLRD